MLVLGLATLLACASGGGSGDDDGGEGDPCEAPAEGPYGIDCGTVAACGSEFWVDGKTALSELSGVTYLRGDLTIASDDLTSLSALSELRCIEGWLYFREYGSLDNLNGLENLRYIGADLSIAEGSYDGEENGHLTDLSALANLSVVGTYMRISDQHELTDLEGLGSLRTVHAVLIEENPVLENLQGLGSLEDVDDGLSVMYNDSLPTCEATGLRDRLIDHGFDGIVCIRDNLADSCGDQMDDGCD